MNRIILIMFLSTLMYSQNSDQSFLYLAVHDKGPTAPPVFFLVDNQSTKEVHKKRWVVVPVKTGEHQLNACAKPGKRDKEAQTDMTVNVEAGQSRYFVFDRPLGKWPMTTYASKYFTLKEVSESEWKFMAQNWKPEKE